MHVKEDPLGSLRGRYLAECTARGVKLERGRKKRKETILLDVERPPERLGGNRFVLAVRDPELGDRDITLAVVRWDIHQERFASDLVEFWKARRELPTPEDYRLPRAATILAMTPLGIAAFGLMGGAIGGALCGGLGFGLTHANLSIARREHWPYGLRLGLSAGLSAVGYSILALMLVGLVWLNRQGRGDATAHDPAGGVRTAASADRTAPSSGAATAPRPASPAPLPGPAVGPPPALPLGGAEPPGPLDRGFRTRRAELGRPEDPDGDCTVSVAGDAAAIDIPGRVHELSVVNGRMTNAPRVLQEVAGDFAAEVKVVPGDDPEDPPASFADVAFHGAGLLLWFDEGRFVRLERAAFVRDGVLHRYFLFELHEGGLTPVSQGFGTSLAEVFLRLERRGPWVVGSYSEDGARWVRLGVVNLPARGACRVGVAAVNTTARPYRAEFSHFRLDTP